MVPKLLLKTTGIKYGTFLRKLMALCSCRKTSPTLHTVDTFLGMLLLSKIISCVSKWFLPALFLSIFERKSENWQANASLFCLSGSTQNLFWKIFKLFFTDRKFQIKGLNEVKELIRILLKSCNRLNHVALFVEKIYSWWQCSKITEKTVCLTLGLLTSGKLQIIFSSYYFDRKTEVS